MKNMMISFIAVICVIFLYSCTPNVNSAYYRSGEGYQKQVIGAVCTVCGNVCLISWAQYDQYEELTCAYCQQKFNVKVATALNVRRVQQADAQAASLLIGSFANGVNNIQNTNSRNNCVYRTYTTTIDNTVKHCTQYPTCNVSCN